MSFSVCSPDELVEHGRGPCLGTDHEATTALLRLYFPAYVVNLGQTRPVRVFLAGAAGAIGRQLLPLLVSSGHQVAGTTRRSAAGHWIAAQGATPVIVDALDAGAVHAAVREFAPDTLVHQLTDLSGGSSADNAKVRQDGTRNLVAAALEVGVGRVVAQSISWAYELGDGPADEATALDNAAIGPRATTIAAIRALEEGCAALAHHVVLRYGVLYGPGTWYARGALMAERLGAGELAANDGVSSFVHVCDAARAAELALGWPSGPVNAVDDEPAPASEWVPALAQALGEPAPARSPGRERWERGALNAKARALGWEPRYSSWRRGFASL